MKKAARMSSCVNCDSPAWSNVGEPCDRCNGTKCYLCCKEAENDDESDDDEMG